MPGTTTHYIFGLNTYKDIENNNIKRTINMHKEAYSVGLQGPDIFFDYIPIYVICRKNIARILHTKNTGAFLINAIRYIDNLKSRESKAIATSYLYGFLGHYILDCTTHPMIYYRTQYQDSPKDYISRHIRLENDINTILLRQFLNSDPFHFNYKNVFALSKKQEKVISNLLFQTIHATYPELRLDNSLLNHTLIFAKYSPQFFVDKKGYKEFITSQIEEYVFKYKLVSSKFVTNTKITTQDPLNLNNDEWYNPWEYKFRSNKSFLDLFEQSSSKYKDLLTKIYQYFETGDNLNLIKATIGNKSYHSGLDCSMVCL